MIREGGVSSVVFSLAVVDVPERPGREIPFCSLRLTTVQDSNVTVLYLISQSAMQDRWIIKESKSGKLFLKTNFFLKEVPNMDCFARYRVAT